MSARISHSYALTYFQIITVTFSGCLTSFARGEKHSISFLSSFGLLDPSATEGVRNAIISSFPLDRSDADNG